MSVVIIGGNECMERQYMDICKKHGCKSKVFCKYRTGLESRIGSPDLMILFVDTISHKAMECAVDSAPESTNIVRSQSSSKAALHRILACHV